MKITSPQNPKIKDIIKLRKAGNRRKQELIIIEGKKEIEMAIAAGLTLKAFFFCPDYKPEYPQPIRIDQKKILVLTKAVFKKISYRDNPDGYLALARPRLLELREIKLSKNPLVLILEAIEKPGNLGAILRTADAAGADAVILCGQTTDTFNPNVIRASRGAIFTVQFTASSAEKTRQWLKINKFNVCAAALDTKYIYTDIDYKGATAFVVGSEHDGLSRTWLEKADVKIKIPMTGKIDSLNASVSAAIIIYEAIRQRNM